MIKKTFFGILILACIVVAVFIYMPKNSEMQKIDNNPAGLSENLQEKLYINKDYKFSFNIPKEFEIREFDEGLHRVIIAKGNGDSIQILISGYDEGDNLTVERIKKDLPEIKIENPNEIKIQGGGGVVFKSDNVAFGGENMEAWFVYKDNLYQVTTSMSQIENLNVIISSWKFE